MEAALERRGLLRSCLAPAPPSVAMERLWSSRMEAACAARRSSPMETPFAIADRGRDRSAGVYRDGGPIRWRVVQTNQRGPDAAWSLVFSIGKFFASARVVSFHKPLPAAAAPSLCRRLARADFVHAAV